MTIKSPVVPLDTEAELQQFRPAFFLPVSYLCVQRVPVCGREVPPGLLQLLQPVHPPLARRRRQHVLSRAGAAKKIAEQTAC